MESNNHLLKIIENMDSEIERAFRGQLWFSYGVSYFEAAKCLMRCKHLPQTILFLHYATERMFKSLLILNDEMSEDDLQNILKHDGTNYFSLYIAHKLRLLCINNSFDEFKRAIDYDLEACQKHLSFEKYNEYIASQKKSTVYSTVFQHFQQYISPLTQNILYKALFNTQEDFDIYTLFVRYLQEKLTEKGINDFIKRNRHYIFLIIFDLKYTHSFNEDLKNFVRKIGKNSIRQIPISDFSSHFNDFIHFYKRSRSTIDFESIFIYHKSFKENPNPSKDEIYDYMFDMLLDIFSGFSHLYRELRYPSEDKENYITKPLDETFMMDSETLHDLEILMDIIETVIKLMNTYFQKEIEFWISMTLYMGNFLDLNKIINTLMFIISFSPQTPQNSSRILHKSLPQDEHSSLECYLQ